MQALVTFTMASVGFSMVGSGTSERRMSRGAWIVVARMSRASHLRRRPSFTPGATSSVTPGVTPCAPDPTLRGDVALSHM